MCSSDLFPSHDRGFGALIGGGLGAVAGSFIPGAGTIAGATVGSAIGGWLGGKTGDDASVSYRDITLNVGDNLTQIYQKFCEIVDASIQKQMDDFQKMVLSMPFPHRRFPCQIPLR